jgi:hypothetical protein
MHLFSVNSASWLTACIRMCAEANNRGLRPWLGMLTMGVEVSTLRQITVVYVSSRMRLMTWWRGSTGLVMLTLSNASYCQDVPGCNAHLHDSGSLPSAITHSCSKFRCLVLKGLIAAQLQMGCTLQFNTCSCKLWETLTSHHMTYLCHEGV